MSHELTRFLLETLLWTGALIALVLVLRRPVARHFGAQAAYMLWFLPLLRLALPPMVLPAWLDPAPPAIPALEVLGASGETMVAERPLALPLTNEAPAAVVSVADPASFMTQFDLLTPLLLVWLAGAAIFVIRRFALYHRMRGELLAEARPVGEAGRVRLVETPSINGPVAFGMIDKVIALPDGFMASRDRTTRDLALAHELAHHDGRDILVNFLVQPLFALHWFNPLGWAGWRAMRRDQEAACDARVVSARPREDRVTYASIIADFACRSNSAPRAALAAPMACPVLGDKSIIHRLRSLSMSDISPRRRLAARSAIGAALLALPLTATISYAETRQEVPEAPLPPAAPAVPIAHDAPEAPPAPAAPIPPDAPVHSESAEHDGHVVWQHHEDVVDEDGTRRVERRVVRTGHGMSAEDRAELRREMAELRKEFGEGGDFQREMEEMQRELRRELRHELGENGEMQREIRMAVAQARASTPKVVMACRNRTQPVTTEVDRDGRTTLYVCETAGDAIAADAMRQARASIAADTHMSAEERAEALRELDEEIAELASN